MRNIVIGIMSFVFLILLTLIIATMYGRSTREDELELAINNALNTAIESLSEERDIKPQNEEELVALFVQSCLTQIDSSSDVDIKVLDVDYDKGLLSVSVTMRYIHPNGREGSITRSEMAVVDKYYKDNIKSEYTISYYIDGSLYREYIVKAGETITVPDVSTTSWEDVSTGSNYTTSELSITVVSKDMILRAQN